MKPELVRRFSVLRIGVFGSFARGDENAESDVDVLVILADPTFDHYMDLKFLLEDTLGRPVDLVLEENIKPRLRPVIEREVIYV
ncbi:nucleotidyltransferase family protein [Myxococcota bacterium]|nr:nucleotidyltransferase family protein [Myxococcota bacterium]